MGFLENLLVGSGAAWLVRRAYRNAQETKRRQNSPLNFGDGVSRQDFINIATAVGGLTSRVVEVDVHGMAAHLRVRSNSGLSDWHATVDFNDYGHLTGTYWIDSENSQSLVPYHFAHAVSDQIERRIGHVHSAHEPARSAPPGWYETDAGLRYWDGAAWTPHLATMSKRRPSGAATITFAWVVAFVTVGYMAPWAIAVTRGTSNRGKVGLVCFFLGWTIVGWIAALIMACAAHQRPAGGIRND